MASVAKEAGIIPLGPSSASEEPGIIPISAEQVESEQAEKYDSPTIAAALGVARGLSFGLSDVLAAQLGFADEAALLKKYNPTASTVGEIGGGIAGLAVPFGAAGLAAKAGGRVAASVGGRALTKAVAGAATEGALAGVGSTISEKALSGRDWGPQEIAERLMANVGAGAVLGGGFSLAGSGISKAAGAAGKKFSKAFAGAENADELAGAVDAINKTGVKVPRSIGQGEKAMATERALAENGGVYMDAVGLSPSTASKARIEGIQDLVQKTGQEVLEGAATRTEAEVGGEFKDKFIKYWANKMTPLEEGFEGIKQSTKFIKLDAAAADSLERGIGRLSSLAADESTERAAMGVVKRIREGKVTSLSELAEIRSDYLQKARKSPGESKALYDVARVLERFENRVISRTAIERAADTGVGEEVAKDLIKTIRQARRGYAKEQGLAREMADRLGVRAKNVKGLVDAIAEMPSEEIGKKFFGGNLRDSESLRWIQTNMPEQFDLLKSVQLKRMGEKAGLSYENGAVLGELDIPKLVKQWKAMTPEARNILFNQEANQTFRNLDTIIAKGGPLLKPLKEKAADVTSILAGLSGAADGLELIRAGYVNGAPFVKKAILSQQGEISSGLKSFLEGAGKSARVGTTTAALFRDDDYKARIEEIAALTSNPSLLADRLAQNTEAVGNYSPDTQMALQAQAIRAADFLASKAPKQPGVGTDIFGNEKPWKPSDTELSKFNRYVRAADEPMSVLGDLKNGTLTREAVETLETLYPSILNEMKSQAIALGAKKKLPYSKQLQLALLLNQPVSYSMQPEVILRMQQMPSAEAQEQNSPSKLKADSIKNAASAFERVATRDQRP
jgi:hypothetical protein